MSSQPDYSFNQPAPSTSEGFSLQLPFALLSTAIAIILIAQTVNTFKGRSALHDGEVQLNDAYRNREAAVKQSGDLQQKLQEIALDLIVLAKTDKEAQAIIAKYNIQQAGNAPAGAPAPAPAPEPAK